MVGQPGSLEFRNNPLSLRSLITRNTQEKHVLSKIVKNQKE